MINYIKEKMTKYYFDKGLEMYKRRDYASASSFFNKALRTAPKYLRKKVNVMIMYNTTKF